VTSQLCHKLGGHKMSFYFYFAKYEIQYNFDFVKFHKTMPKFCHITSFANEISPDFVKILSFEKEISQNFVKYLFREMSLPKFSEILDLTRVYRMPGWRLLTS